MTERGRIGVWCFGLGFVISVGSSCVELVDDGCSCPQPERPEYRGVLPVKDISEYGEGPLTLAPGIENGTFMLTENDLTISYGSDGADYTVRYVIGEPLSD